MILAFVWFCVFDWWLLFLQVWVFNRKQGIAWSCIVVRYLNDFDLCCIYVIEQLLRLSFAVSCFLHWACLVIGDNLLQPVICSEIVALAWIFICDSREISVCRIFISIALLWLRISCDFFLRFVVFSFYYPLLSFSFQLVIVAGDFWDFDICYEIWAFVCSLILICKNFQFARFSFPLHLCDWAILTTRFVICNF